ncbi:trypsin-like serine protease (plasmid) [Rhizobium ruizarguesonis]|uniref:Trypsin-like serine protease n=1 Tax=Rhizobium ruizarguesonis TaxID=2081791 RepID=A0AAE8Q6T8_9HYPH|nr:trypsin-like serine protease [Rhizobium ruizarguesonis]MCB2401811.1 trypsin-like serine protease [Rhizobium ruizarguesonis]NEI49747.1 trypsin-like serine protease [Rhizobium ruizarguesonis]TAY70050.1 trypsin-like serine protease [Rhizobium ruizarguesonis]TAZ25921.1 trypsin-like serine protease [Rhizobium ruizarguesonis]TBA55928.1 trypsin-like serine protease [Rhizobium ruizarguesonis]
MSTSISRVLNIASVMLLLAAPVLAQQDTDFAGEDGGRVIGGQAAKKGEWPWQVKILAPDPEQRGRFGGHCGGSLIAPRWILTAAHCVTSGRSGKQDLFARDLLIVEGKSKIDKVISVDGPDKPGLAVEDVIIHEDFDRKVFANDIALIKLSDPAKSKPAILASASDDEVEAAGHPAVVTGWGYTKADHGWDDKYLPTELQEVELPIVPREDCRAAYRDSSMRMNPIDERNVCAGYAEGGKDACQGDSGGPLVAQRPDKRWIQLGIVSWGAGCAEAEHYGVYTRVAAFRDWIAAKTDGDVPNVDEPAADDQVASTTSGGGTKQRQSGQEEANLAITTPPVGDTAPAATTEMPNAPAGDNPPADKPAVQPPVVQTPVIESSPGDRALLIGIDDYEMREAKLTGSATDVKAMQVFLVKTLAYRPEQIHTLTNRKATREAILAEIDDWLVRQSTPGSRVFLYFSGQGSEEMGAEETTSPTLVAVDAKLVREAGKVTVTNEIRETEIAARLNSLKDRRVTLLIDACHVGPGSRSAVAAPSGTVRCLGPALAALEPPNKSGKEAKFSFGGESAMVWSAVNAGQWALVDREAKPPVGVFTRRFIEGVQDGVARAADKPNVSNAALLDYVRRKSDEYCRTHAEDCRFTPVPQFYGQPDALGRDVITGEEAKTAVAAVENTLKSDNEAGVAVDVLPGTAVSIGDKVAMRVSTKKSGYLILVDIDASGKLTQLFPNKRSMGLKPSAKSGDNRLDPARPVVVPDARNPYTGFEYVVEGPAGVGMVVAILSDKPIEVLDLPDVPTPLVGQRAAFNYVYDLARSLRIVGDDETGAQGKWSFDSKFYRVR